MCKVSGVLLEEDISVTLSQQLLLYREMQPVLPLFVLSQICDLCPLEKLDSLSFSEGAGLAHDSSLY